MQQDVSFEFNHLGHTWDVDATFEREDKPAFGQTAETGYEGEWQLHEIEVIGADGMDWYAEMRDFHCVKRPLTLPPVMQTVADLVLEQAYGELE